MINRNRDWIWGVVEHVLSFFCVPSVLDGHDQKWWGRGRACLFRDRGGLWWIRNKPAREIGRYARGSIALMAAMELQTATFSYEPVPGSSGHGGYPHLGSDQDEEIMIAALRAQTVTGVTPEKVQEFNSPVGSGPWNPDGGYSITPGDIMNSSPGSGLDMHRRLHNRLDPTDMVTSFRWLRAFMSTETVPDVGGLDPGY